MGLFHLFGPVPHLRACSTSSGCSTSKTCCISKHASPLPLWLGRGQRGNVAAWWQPRGVAAWQRGKSRCHSAALQRGEFTFYCAACQRGNSAAALVTWQRGRFRCNSAPWCLGATPRRYSCSTTPRRCDVAARPDFFQKLNWKFNPFKQTTRKKEYKQETMTLDVFILWQVPRTAIQECIN